MPRDFVKVATSSSVVSFVASFALSATKATASDAFKRSVEALALSLITSSICVAAKVVFSSIPTDKIKLSNVTFFKNDSVAPKETTEKKTSMKPQEIITDTEVGQVDSDVERQLNTNDGEDKTDESRKLNDKTVSFKENAEKASDLVRSFPYLSTAATLLTTYLFVGPKIGMYMSAVSTTAATVAAIVFGTFFSKVQPQTPRFITVV